MEPSTIFAIIIAFAIAAVLIWLVERRDRRKGIAWRIGASFDYEQSFNIAGINKYGLAPADCGTWKGFVTCEPDNPYDPNAVAVTKGASQHVGYLSKEIAATHSGKIQAEGGQLPCLVRIERKFDEEKNRHYFIGRVQILWPGTE